jgi:DNA-binding XRE family transcriptional regulator
MKKQPFAEFRKNAGLTIDEAAKRFGVDRTTIMRWEKGSPKIPLKRIDDARNILGANARELRPDIFEVMQ